MQIYVIRHCEATGQSEDAPLTTKGFVQAEGLAEFLLKTGIERVICSPYLRAQQTIEPYIQRHNASLTIDSRLSERVLSVVSMENWLECLQQTFDDFDLSFRGGESSRRAMARAVDVIKDIDPNESKRIGIVTHGNLMTLLLRHFDARFGFDHWSHLTNPDVFLVSVEQNKATVERVWKNLD
ncbi:histidine phosphatase family protein [Alicyclobacillus fastidiosus]|uniref:Histidine phosphatase family protein n=1 Tax=Alicyclobacillus fastidiosus TaxID=392011 RepID=A0ABV5AL21_9BACL|nr:histidine phosphatase family protein [Alicyclobacillus fastidiosus]WEH08320.1 phosphoglycerate mutase family protein [Alicyclobacillus fastidiosus]